MDEEEDYAESRAEAVYKGELPPYFTDEIYLMMVVEEDRNGKA